jgi:hypothetical protein
MQTTFRLLLLSRASIALSQRKVVPKFLVAIRKELVVVTLTCSFLLPMNASAQVVDVNART